MNAMSMKMAFLVGIFSVLCTCFADSPIKYRMEKISVEKAKSVLKTGKPAKLYPSAVAAVLASDMKEEEKHEYLLILYLSAEKIEEYREGARQLKSPAWGFGTALQKCAQQLKKPEVFFSKMAKHRLYQPIKGKFAEKPKGYPDWIWSYQGCFLLAMMASKSITKEVLEQWLPIAFEVDHTGYSTNPLRLVAKHGDAAALGKVLGKFANWSEYKRCRFVPQIVSERRTLPCVIEFYCGAILISSESGWLRRCLLSVRKFERARSGYRRVTTYSKVDPANAERIMKALDTLMVKKDFLLNHKKKNAKWTNAEFERLERIRAQMAQKTKEYKQSLARENTPQSP